MYYVDKPKVFIRFFPGASGNFFALFLHTLAQDVTELPKDEYSKHISHPIINQGHNFREQYYREPDLPPNFLNNFHYYLQDKSTVEKAASYLTDNYRFSETPNLIYTIPTHAMQPLRLFTAFPSRLYNTKLINIQHSYSDIPQILYNYITKGFVIWKRIDFVKKLANSILKQYPEKAKNSKFNIDDTVFEDTRFLCYLYLHGMTDPNGFYNNFLKNTLTAETQSVKPINIPFASINDLTLISQINMIVDYLGIESTPERKRNAEELLIKYTEVQTKNPYTDLHIDDY